MVIVFLNLQRKNANTLREDLMADASLLDGSAILHKKSARADALRSSVKSRLFILQNDRYLST